MTIHTPKLLHLEGLRGLAALAVAVYHFAIAFFPAMQTGNFDHYHTLAGTEIKISVSVFNVFFNGNFAVCLFFTLSGYVLSYAFFRGDSGSIVSGAVRRYVRLCLPALASVILSFLILSAGGYFNREAAEITGSAHWLGKAWTMNASLPDALAEGSFYAFFGGSSMQYNPLLWTMNVEFMGSLFTFALLALTGKLRNKGIIYLLLAILLYKTYFWGFMLGILLCYFFHSGEARKFSVFTSIACILSGLYLGGFSAAPVPHAWTWLQTEFPLIHPQHYYSLGGALLIAGLEGSARAQKILSASIFTFLGKISFSFYLLNEILLGSAGCFIFLWLIQTVQLDYQASALGAFLAGMLLLIPLSWFYYRWIDRGSIRLSRWFYETVFRERGEKNAAKNPA
ncbi:MAG: acyltransferase 3 [Bacteroidetes bacterium]|nr:MAG: acyltransferase 3 [Bacteroidota bacterium]